MRFLLALLLFPTLFLRAADPFEIKHGDRVLFLGDTLLEREGTYGYLETRMHEQFPDRQFTVRNLAFSADTPRGWSRASFDPADKGFERLKEQLEMVKPTVVFLGYGMAASLQEMTDRSGDPTLNPDPARYGAEPMSAGRFKKELGELMDAINESAPKMGAAIANPNLTADGKAAPVRFVLMSPIRHEDLRATRPGLPDPKRHNELLEQYSRAIEELAQERGGRFANITEIRARMNVGWHQWPPLTDNGIHISRYGYDEFAHVVADELGWKNFSFLVDPDKQPQRFRGEKLDAVQTAIIRKNELFFHQWRPANSTYLFGFRKHEQGQNAKEMPMFDPLIAAAEAEIDRLKKPGATPAPAGSPSQTSPGIPQTVPGAPANQAGATPAVVEAAKAASVAPLNDPPLPKPDFTVADGYQIELWAENPLLYKPTQMNWDAQGRLWVASSALYPQIAPGGEATDTVLILEDTDRDGRADKSTVFAGGLLIPTAVQPGYVPRKDGSIHYSCYVGQSTELLHFEDTDGDGRADTKRIVLSGFGTEDTHHIIHTLRRGPDRRLYFNQSVYIHSHLETPQGVVRVNSGAVLAWDPRTEKVEVFSKGLWNTWGHQFDKWGQSFQTDGAGSTGITWSFPGATFAPFEGARRTFQSISPGAYPKFAGLELIYSPHFPADWQGNAVTCDFRAHRIVRFGITDLSLGEKPQAGFTTTEMPDLVRTSDVAFRPIDVKLGPDGALYIADWSNPVINHGEVDFRDPRRDHTHGRIWRVSRKRAPLAKWESLTGKKNPELLDKLLSESLWEKEQARAVLGKRLVMEIEEKKASSRATGLLTLGNDEDAPLTEVSRWYAQAPTEDKLREVALLESSFATIGWARFPALNASADARNHALTARLMAGLRSRGGNRLAAPAPATPAPADTPPNPTRNLYSLPKLARDPNPRVRLEALRALARFPTPQSYDLVLDAGAKSEGDPFLEYAAWLSINDLAPRWTKAIAQGEWKVEGREKQLEYGLNAIDPALAGPTITQLLANPKVDFVKGPWIELIGRAGGPAELTRLYDSLLLTFGEECCAGNDRDFVTSRATVLKEDEGLRAVAALLEAARVRNLRPDGTLAFRNFGHPLPEKLEAQLARLAGYWKTADAPLFLTALAQPADKPPALRLAAIEGLRSLGGQDAELALVRLSGDDTKPPVRRAASIALAGLNAPRGMPFALKTLWAAKTEEEALEVWRELLKVQGLADKLAKAVVPGAATSLKPGNLTTPTGDVIAIPADKPILPIMPKLVATAGVKAAREGGRKTQTLLAALTPLAGLTAALAAPANYAELAAQTKRNGDPAQGELIYRRATSGCVTCHAIGGAGGLVGPSLTSLGASAPLDYIIESMLAPAAKVKEGYNAVTLKLKDGTEATGIQARETAQEVILRNVAGQETAVPKANITGKTDVGSIMPAGLLEQFKDRERLNLYAFLGELGKPGPYDASKGGVARVWRLYPGTSEAQALQQDMSVGYVMLLYTNVDGRVAQETIAEALPWLGDAGKDFYVSAQFQVATGGKVRLNLTGIRTAWLDGKPLAVASEPNPSPELAPGIHTLAVKIDRTALPVILRAEAEGVNFLGN